MMQDPELAEIAEELGTEWESVAVRVGIKQVKINRYKEDNPGNSLGAIRRMLMEWRHTQPGDVDSRAALAIALTECGRTDLAEKVRGKGMIDRR